MDMFHNENAGGEEKKLSAPQAQPAENEVPSPTVAEDRSESAAVDASFMPSEADDAQAEPAFEAAAEEFPYDPEEEYFDEPPKRSRVVLNLVLRFVAGIMCGLVLIGCCYYTGTVVSDRWQERLEQITSNYDAKLNELEKQIAEASRYTGISISGSPAPVGDGMTPGQVYAENVRSVVMIYAEVSTTIYGQVSKSTSTGSGFILTESGYVVTNYHVVEDATGLRVQLFDSTELDAELIGADSANDIALLKIEHEGLRPVKVGSSDKLIVGDQVVAIGNPLGELTSTLTVGYVSAKERDVSTDGTVINMIQTDAAINSGNSGGPLFNMLGEVVGITTAKYSGTSNSGATIEGIGFAIPIDDVYDMFEDLMNFGYITGAYMGIEVSDTDSSAATYFGYPLGAYVHSVEKDSCAQKAGIMAKDIIISLGEYEVGGLNDLSRALRKFDAGDTTTVVVFRLGQEITLDITFDSKPQSNTAP